MPAPVEITFRGLRSNPRIEATVREWVMRLQGVYDRILAIGVVIEQPHRRHRKGRRFHVAVRIAVPAGQVIVSRDPGRDEPHENVYIAIRDAFLAARRQLENHVRRMRDVTSTTAPSPDTIL